MSMTRKLQKSGGNLGYHLLVPALWHRLWSSWLVRLYFDRIRLLHPERLPQGGPVLYLGLHRNGAVDGLVYRHFLPKAVFLISVQLRRSPLGRLFFEGIEVAREQDAGEEDAQEALERCLAHLRSGGSLFIFPEGTSTLGPRHLPFKSGAARLLAAAVGEGLLVKIVPLDVRYERAWAFRSRAEVVVGEPLPLGALEEGVGGIRRRVRLALEALAAEFESEEAQDEAERLAYVSTLGTGRSYAESLKAFSSDVPRGLREAWAGLEPEILRRGLWLHQGVPLFPMGSRALYAAALLVTGPIVLAAAALNALPLLAGWAAGEALPDGRNVVSLWRILIGAPVFVLWALLVAAGRIWRGDPFSLAVYLLLTWAGLKLYDRVKKLAAAVHNGFLHPDLGPRLLAFREETLKALESAGA